MITPYAWAGGREAMVRVGPIRGPVVIAVLPPFEEANRTRSFVMRVLRLLANNGIGGAIPDLPGTGESLIGTEAVRLEDWRQAFAAAAAALAAGGARVHALSVRAGALIDREADLASRYHFAPQTGDALVRELHRIQAAGADVSEPDAPVLEVAGNRIARSLLESLGGAIAADRAPIRVTRLDSDPAPADRRMTAPPLWRRAEPGDDPQLAQALAADLTEWIVACGG